MENCPDCSIEKVISVEGYYVCPECGRVDSFGYKPEAWSHYSSSITPNKIFYKRQTQLLKTIEKINGCLIPPPHIIATIESHISPSEFDTIYELGDLFVARKLRKYNKYLYYIYHHFKKQRAVNLDYTSMTKILKRFKELEKEYVRVYKNRNNFIGYSFLINKICKELRIKADIIVPNLEKTQSAWETIYMQIR